MRPNGQVPVKARVNNVEKITQASKYFTHNDHLLSKYIDMLLICLSIIFLVWMLQNLLLEFVLEKILLI